MNKKEILLLVIVLAVGFLLVYSPHINSPFPIHIDEWHHITEAQVLKNNLSEGSIINGFYSVEIGFHLFLVIISFLFDLVLLYQFLPAIWAVVTGIVLFFIMKDVTRENKNSYFLSIFAVIFFFSIKSNLNLLGLSFFTPLSFAIPFIFLYIYYFSKGINEGKNKLLIVSLLIMLFLIFTHALSVLAFIPMLLLFALLNYKNVLKNNIKVLILFLLIPIVGLLFYKTLLNVNTLEALNRIFGAIIFTKGWGVLELSNSPFQLYSLIGYILAIVGVVYLVLNKSLLKKNLIYILWPVSILILIIIFKFTGLSYLSPYQRNLYYLVLALPYLSALGLMFSLRKIKEIIVKSKFKMDKKQIYKNTKIIILIAIIFLAFVSYFSIPDDLRPDDFIDSDDYNDLEYLSTLSEGKVMAPLRISTAIYPVTEKHKPVATVYFYGNRDNVVKFFDRNVSCDKKNSILNAEKVSYIISRDEIGCDWDKVYDKGNLVIYQV